MNFPHIALQLFNRPLLLHPQKAEIILGALAGRLGIAQLRLPDGRLRALDGAGMVSMADQPPPDDDDGCGYQVIAGVAVIEVRGTLVQRQMGLRPWSGMTGYNAIRANFCMALDDPAVKAVAFDIDSPGGDCAGLFDLTDEIFACRGTKPIWAILDESAASAAYAIAAACDRVIVPRTGYSGSVGVIVLHVDLSQMLAREGVTVSILQFGARKADGQPSIPLSDPARATLQADIDTIGELFVSSIARYRGVATARVRATEAAVFLGGAGREAGLVDVVQSPAAAFAALARMTLPPARPDDPRGPSRQEMFKRNRPGAAIAPAAVRQRWR